MELNNWYEEAFGEDYLKIYNHRNDEEAEQDIINIINVTGAHKDWKILDLCCGTGRHLRALYNLGFEKIAGIDLSPHLLKRAVDFSGDISLIQGDMRYIPLRESFDLILSLFTSFGYFFNDNENLSVLREINRCLCKNGKFFLDYVNRIYLEKNLVPEDIAYKDGKEIRSRRWITSNGLRVEKEMIIIDGINQKKYCESVRLFTLNELISLMEKAGFSNIQYYSGMSINPFTESSPRVTVTGEKR